MVATSRDELRAVTDHEYQRLITLVNDIDPEFALAADADGISIKDVIGHRAHWLELVIGWHDDGLAGRDLVYPAAGYQGNETRRYNADLRSAQVEVGWDDVCSMLHDAHRRLVQLIANRPGLYDGPMVAPHKWTTGRWFEANGPSHYRSAAKYIRTRLRHRQT